MGKQEHCRCSERVVDPLCNPRPSLIGGSPVSQVDMWALGISVIEMAEVVPPRWKVRGAWRCNDSTLCKGIQTSFGGKPMHSNQQPLGFAAFETVAACGVAPWVVAVSVVQFDPPCTDCCRCTQCG
jgi:serine/threonine protein kinase